jgi:hypothetical protein
MGLDGMEWDRRLKNFRIINYFSIKTGRFNPENVLATFGIWYYLQKKLKQYQVPNAAKIFLKPKYVIFGPV